MLAALLIGLMGLDSISALPEMPAPTDWSPDGRWLAYVVEARPVAAPVEPGWLFRSAKEDRAEPSHALSKTPATSYRLWTSCPETGESVLLDESRGPISAPCWNRDGTAVGFARVNRGTEGSSRWEVVVQSAPDRQRVLMSEPIAAGAEPSADCVRILAPAFSGDGRFLAAPTLKPSGVVVLRSDSGKQVRSLPGASQPRWAPAEARLLFTRFSAMSGTYVLDTPTHEPRRVADVPAPGDRLPCPLWSRDGQAVLTFRRVPQPIKEGAQNVGQDTIDLVRSRADNGLVEFAIPLNHDPIGGEGTLAGAWFSADPDGEDLYLATAMKAPRTVQMRLFRIQDNLAKNNLIPLDSPNPYDATSNLGALSARPGGRGVAFRVGLGDEWTPPAAWNPRPYHLTLLTPDAESRDFWRARIVATIVTLLRDLLPIPALADGTAVERPSLLPAPGELEPNAPVIARLRGLARLGLSVLGPASAGKAMNRPPGLLLPGRRRPGRARRGG